MKIKVLGIRNPWIDGAPRGSGWTGDVDDKVGKGLIENGLAEEVVTRARKGDGTYQADDPATPENEAYNPPKKPARRKKKAAE